MDLKKMQALLDQMQKKGTGEVKDNFFRPQEGENLIRIVPRKGSPDDPFQNLLFHYLGGKTILSPRNFGEVDPIADFSDALIAQGNGKLSKDEFKAAKKFSPQLRTYAYVIDRNNEEAGVRPWGFGKTTAEAIIKISLDADYGDVTDVEKGFDLKVSFTPKEKSDTAYAKTEVRPVRKESPLSKNGEQVNDWLTNQPSITDNYKKWTKEELNAFLHNYLSPDATITGTSTVAVDTSPNVKVETLETTTSTSAIPKDVDDEFSKIFNG
jgi:hypothetical protein